MSKITRWPRAAAEDQYRPMTPGEEEIMRIHGIYCSPDMIEGFWITSSSMKPGESCFLQTAPQQPATAAWDSDSELEKLLRDTPEPNTPPLQSPPPGPQLTPGAARITKGASHGQQEIWKLLWMNYRLGLRNSYLG